MTTLTSEVATLSVEEETKYAEELLPCSSHPDSALSVPLIAAEDLEEHEVMHSLKGIHFKALSAPGPSGARPEHLRELLACPNKRVSRRLVGSLSNFVDAATRGKLIKEARFILDSRVVYLRKKE